MKRISLFSLVLFVSLFVAVIANAAPVVLDAEKARETAGRADRASIEGLWAVIQKWDPDPAQDHSYRIAIVRNNHGVFKDAKYLGVVLCEKKGVVKGEVKLLLSPTKKKNEFNATWHTNKGNVKGLVTLGPRGDGTPDSIIDTTSLKWKDGHVLMDWIARLKEN